MMKHSDQTTADLSFINVTADAAVEKGLSSPCCQGGERNMSQHSLTCHAGAPSILSELNKPSPSEQTRPHKLTRSSSVAWAAQWDVNTGEFGGLIRLRGWRGKQIRMSYREDKTWKIKAGDPGKCLTHIFCCIHLFIVILKCLFTSLGGWKIHFSLKKTMALNKPNKVFFLHKMKNEKFNYSATLKLQLITFCFGWRTALKTGFLLFLRKKWFMII